MKGGEYMEDEMTALEFKYFLLKLAKTFEEFEGLLESGDTEKIKKRLAEERKVIDEALK